MKPLAVIALQFNHSDLTVDLLKSIEKMDPGVIDGSHGIDFHLIDNASSENDNFSLIRARYPWVILHKNEKNLGFARGINQGIKSLNSSYQNILLINNDMLLLGPTITKSLDYMNTLDADVLTCSLISKNGRRQQNISNFPSPIGYWMQNISGIWNVRRRVINNFFNFARVGYINGAFMMIRLDLFQKLDGFCEEYFMYGEDLEFNMRLNKAGAKLYVLPKLKVLHLDGASGTDIWTSQDKFSLQVSHTFHAYRKHYNQLAVNLYKLGRLLSQAIKIHKFGPTNTWKAINIIWKS